jgi:phosphoglycolate phosphatase
MTIPPRHLIIFDIDGTLILSGPVVRECFAEAFHLACDVEAPLWGVHFAGMTDRGIFRLLLEKAGLDGDFESRFQGFRQHFVEIMESRYQDSHGPHLMPGVVELLETLSARTDVGLLLGSGNLRETASIKLARFDLERFFVGGVFGGDHAERTDIFLRALELGRSQLGWRGEAADAWVIGDTLADLDAARGAGMRMLAVATGPIPTDDLREAGADAWLADLGDTERALELLELGSGA